MKIKIFPTFLMLLVSLIAGALLGMNIGLVKSGINLLWGKVVLKESSEWSRHFELVEFRAHSDDVLQAAYFLKAAEGLPMPLVVSLHSWSGDYSQFDELAPLVREEGWNYIHPDFRGPNRTVEACLSEKVVPDIDDAIQYAVDNGNVDENNIFIIGSSGGGYATLGTYVQSRHRIRAFLAWASISDLSTWYYQSKYRKSGYDQDILDCTSEGKPPLNRTEAIKRSPQYWALPKNFTSRLELYAGFNDGYEGSVPISHSIRFYNKVAEHFGYDESLIDGQDTLNLMTRGLESAVPSETIGERQVLYRKATPAVSLTVFEGGHEMLSKYSIDRMKQLMVSTD